MPSGTTWLVCPCISHSNPSRMPRTSTPSMTLRIVAAPMTLLMPGAGPPPTRMPSLPRFACTRTLLSLDPTDQCGGRPPPGGPLRRRIETVDAALQRQQVQLAGGVLAERRQVRQVRLRIERGPPLPRVAYAARFVASQAADDGGAVVGVEVR